MAGEDKIVMTIDPKPIEISGAELGRRLAEMPDESQAAVFLAMAVTTEGWWWGMQCRNIVDRLEESERGRIAAPLEMLVEHLRENSTVNSVRPTLTRHRMPEQHALVIVNGGLAIWTGSAWLSKTHGDSFGRVIEWPVLWWLPLLDDEAILDASERPGPPCQLSSPGATA